ncbi:FMN-dependent NADH-azoreductase [Pseudomonas costantinii]|uniref:FMN dependent NADH:quinone oxidoreductase n=1 Tax=Pseudomonas costantinii TaxID=168469 RepID=A0A1S2V9S0_9PSED|nr:NAD(P)H-dependent oxidoreductase [Pseudomonas costantinii]NVZ18833.1 NAD(P)H-dependent oxidoreductase [Pseudomonas costantinii]OIN55085.1 FMN-dependent NADH-azoreductase [Pseudomonas costantinii]SEE12193.1 FMN-dependent NADH-azoreductase [Pseudomonas costantinii]
MKKMLMIHASPRGERSHSRRLAESFLDTWHTANPSAQVTRREVGRAFIPHVSEAFVAANFYPEPQSLPKVMKADLQLSDELVNELIGHELLVISMPLYNFGVPSGLKAWIDQIVRLGLTFDIAQDSDGIAQYQALLTGKKALIITSRGGSGFGPGGEYEWMNHADPHLRTVLGYIGIDDIQVVAAEGEESDKSVFQRSCEEAERQLHDLARRF